jgi:hypothetical protein
MFMNPAGFCWMPAGTTTCTGTWAATGRESAKNAIDISDAVFI